MNSFDEMISASLAAALRVEKWAWWYYLEALRPFRRLTTPDCASQPQHLTPTKP